MTRIELRSKAPHYFPEKGDLLRTRELMARLGFRDKKAVLKLFRGAWRVPGGTKMLPGRGPSGYEYAVPASFFEKWLQSREVAI